MKKTILLSLSLASIFGFFQFWNITGNTATNANLNFLGTINNQPLILKSNNIEGLRVLVNGQVRIGQNDVTTSSAALRVFKSDIASLEIANSLGRLELVKVNCAGCGARGANVGDAVIRNLWVSGNTILYIPNDNNDGNNYIGFGDDANSTWAKIFNNKTAKFSGKIFANEVEVKTNVWADYVFKKDYDLATLEEVEKHIVEKGHLFNIPSADEVVKNGINLGEMDSKLLSEIEELTLYSIDLNKKNKTLDEKIQQQEQIINELSRRMNQLEKQSH